MNRFNNAFQGKSVFVTGNTGFKGSWLSVWLRHLGATVHGFANGVPTTPSLFESGNLREFVNYFEGDVRNRASLVNALRESTPDFVFHLAAQPLVRYAYREPIETFETNVMGTANVLEALRNLDKPCSAVMITSDKSYDNVEWLWGYRENDALGGKDPYSGSKAGAEAVIKSYYHSFLKDHRTVRIAVARAGNVIGGGDWAVDRIVPDAVRAWSSGKTLEVRSPRATRPWQHVLEPLSGYLHLAASLAENPSLNGEAFNFGPAGDLELSVGGLLTKMTDRWEGAEWRDVSDVTNFHESMLLKLNCDKALHRLNWTSNLNLEETIRYTIDWYKSFYNQENPLTLTQKQIHEYELSAFEKRFAWTGAKK